MGLEKWVIQFSGVLYTKKLNKSYFTLLDYPFNEVLSPDREIVLLCKKITCYDMNDLQRSISIDVGPAKTHK